MGLNPTKEDIIYKGKIKRDKEGNQNIEFTMPAISNLTPQLPKFEPIKVDSNIASTINTHVQWIMDYLNEQDLSIASVVLDIVQIQLKYQAYSKPNTGYVYVSPTPAKGA